MHFAIAYALFAIACTVLALRRHPIYALYFYLSTTYIHPPSRWWAVQYLPDMRWAVLGAALCVLAVVVHRDRLAGRQPLASSAPVIILCLYAALMWLQMLWALDIDDHETGTITFTKYILALWFVYRIADTKELIRDVMLFHAAGCTILAVLARYYEERTNGRIEGVGAPGIDDANSLGMFLCTGVVVCLCLVVSQRGWRRWTALGMMLMTFVGFTMTESRGAFVGMAVGTLVLLLLLWRTHAKAVVGIGVLALLVVFAMVRRDQGFIERLGTIGDVAAAKEDEDADASARSRAVIKDAQLRMASDYPMGAGHRGTAALAPLYLESKYLVGGGADNGSRSSHNTFLSALVEQGVLGAALYLALVAWLLATIARAFRMGGHADQRDAAMLAAGLCAGLTVVFVAGMATDYLITEVQFWLYGLLISALRLRSPVTSSAPAAPNTAARTAGGTAALARQRGHERA